MKIKTSKIIIIMFGTLASFLSFAGSKIDYREYDKNTLKEFESVGVYIGHINNIEIVSDGSGGGSAAIAVTNAVVGLAGVLVATLAHQNKFDSRRGEGRDIYAFPPEGIYMRAPFSVVGGVVDWNTEWNRLLEKTANAVKSSRWFSALYFESVEKKYSPHIIFAGILKAVESQNKAPDGAIELLHSLRFSKDMRRLWYVVDMTAFDAPDKNLVSSKISKIRDADIVNSKSSMKKLYELIKWLGVTRFAAVHEFSRPYTGDEFDKKEEEILAVVNGLASEVNEMMSEYFMDEMEYSPGQDNDEVVVVKNPDGFYENRLNLNEELRSTRKKLGSSSGSASYTRRWKRNIKKMEYEERKFNQMSDEEIEEYNRTTEFKFESTFNLVDRTDTRYRLYNKEKNDYVSIPTSMSGSIIELLDKNDEFKKESKLNYSGVSYVSQGMTRLEYSILYSESEYLRYLGAALLEMESRDKYVLEASATRLLNKMETEETKNIHILARMLGESRNPAFRHVLEEVRNDMKDNNLEKILNAEIDKLGKSNVAQFMPNIIDGNDDKVYMRNAASEVVKAGLNEGGGRELLYIFRWVQRSADQNQNLMDDIALAFIKRHKTSDDNVVYSLKQFCKLLGANPRYRKMFEMLIKKDGDFQLKSLLEKVYKKMPKGDVEQFSW